MSVRLPLVRPTYNHIQRFWKYWAGATGSVALISAIYEPLWKAIDRWLPREIVPRAGTNIANLAVKGIVPTLIACGIIALSMTTGLCSYTLVVLGQARREEKTGKKRGTTLVNTFHRTMQAADRIWHRLFLGLSRPLKKVVKCKQVWTIDENGDCHFYESVTFTTKDRDIHFMQKGIDAEQVADPAEFPDDIDLKIESGANGEIAYLINENGPWKKRFIVFFLPFIKAGGKDQRELITSYYWKGLMRGLIAKGEEPFCYRVESADPIPEVEYQFWIKRRMGSLAGVLTGDNLGKDTNGQDVEKLVPCEDNQMGMIGCAYTARNLPGNHVTCIRLELRNT